MAKYLVLIYGDEQRWDARTDDELRALERAHADFAAGADGAVLSGLELASTSTATSIRSGTSGPVVTDGPFVETREVVGGLYLIEAADLDEALAIAQRVPEVAEQGSGVEVRPVVNG